MFRVLNILPQWWGTIPWELRFLVVREIDYGNWLARGYMPAHQHCAPSRRVPHGHNQTKFGIIFIFFELRQPQLGQNTHLRHYRGPKHSLATR